MTSSLSEAPVLSLEGITKRFGSLTANNDISIDIVPGRIHCLLGENGAGKSTFLRTIYGDLDPTTGTIALGPGERLSVLSQDTLNGMLIR